MRKMIFECTKGTKGYLWVFRIFSYRIQHLSNPLFIPRNLRGERQIRGFWKIKISLRIHMNKYSTSTVSKTGTLLSAASIILGGKKS